jgi:hypothetical protein
MGDYFKPLRRKIGVLTLVMALVIMGGWARSFAIADIGSLAVTDWGRTFELHSHNGTMEWHVFRSNPISCPDWISCPIINYQRVATIGLSVNGCGEQIHSMTGPHWSIALPLTLLSAWLLLRKPRPAKKADELKTAGA